MIVERLGQDGYTDDQMQAALELELGELITQTRLDEALACDRALQGAGVLVPAPVLARIAEHRRDLRAAKRGTK